MKVVAAVLKSHSRAVYMETDFFFEKQCIYTKPYSKKIPVYTDMLETT